MLPHDARQEGSGNVNEVRVRLSDGNCWGLPLRAAVGSDPEYDGLLAAAIEAEDRPQRLRAELALTIFLLDRAYELPPDRLGSLLSFEPESLALIALQTAVHDLVLRSMERSRAARSEAARASGSPALKHATKRAPRFGLLRRF